MTTKTVFDFDNYKAYLSALWGGDGARTGVKQKAAKSMNCHTAYVSQVLNHHAHFSLEQAQKLNEFLGHSEEQAHFFLLLVQFNRAGTQELKSYFKKQIDEIRQHRRHVLSRVALEKNLTDADRLKYYERWIPLAIHVAISVPELQTREALSTYFGIPISIVQSTLDFLIGIGAAKEERGRYSVSVTNLHLGHNSPLILRHHTNWRLQAMKALDKDAPQNMHYSVVYSLSLEDAEKLRKKFIDLIEENLKVVAPSKEEAVFCNVIDFFELKGL